MTLHRPTRSLFAAPPLAALLLLSMLVPQAFGERGPLVASGRLTGPSGTPLAGTVSAWFLDPAGGTLTPVASAPTAADGSYALHLPERAAMQRAAARNGGWVNLILAGGSASEQGAVAITRRLRKGSWRSPSASLRTDLPATTAVTPSERADIVTFAAAAALDGRAAQAQMLYTCFPDVVDTWKGYTVVGEVHTWTDHTARWSYGKTADSDIGVGVSYDGKGWSESGSFHVGTSSSSTVTKRAGSRYGRLLLTRFEYQHVRLLGYCPFLPAEMISATRWLSGLVEGASVRNYDGYCGSYYAAHAAEFGPNTVWSRDRSDYATFQGAVNAFGLITLSAQSGLSSKVKMTHTFGSGKTHRLCGNDDDVLRASRIFAG